MSKIAIFLHPSAHKHLESGEDFLVDATPALLSLMEGEDRILLPVREVDRLVGKSAGARIAQMEEPSMILLVRRD